MAYMEIDGLRIAYKLLGQEGAPTVVLTPGGRFSKEEPGVPELGEALAQGGKRVLLWDRPNCGESDICFEGEAESEMMADVLGKLIRKLELGPVALVGGSHGSRVSLICSSRNSEMITHVGLWWISGGNVGLTQLAWVYCGESANYAGFGGMEAVASSPSWSEQIAKNPKARAQMLNYKPKDFIAKMQRWALAYNPNDISPVPGMLPKHFARLTMPVMIFRNGLSDIAHPRETTDWVHWLIPQSKIIDPPWQDQEWSDHMAKAFSGQKVNLFGNWPKLAPSLLEFLK
jgi:pimeloyl-ACP methyl ester carboxylesterase